MHPTLMTTKPKDRLL